MKLGHLLLFALCVATSSSLVAQAGDRLELGRLQTGATVSFIRSASGEWGLEITGGLAPRISQAKPAKL